MPLIITCRCYYCTANADAEDGLCEICRIAIIKLKDSDLPHCFIPTPKQVLHG